MNRNRKNQVGRDSQTFTVSSPKFSAVSSSTYYKHRDIFCVVVIICLLFVSYLSWQRLLAGRPTHALHAAADISSYGIDVLNTLALHNSTQDASNIKTRRFSGSINRSSLLEFNRRSLEESTNNTLFKTETSTFKLVNNILNSCSNFEFQHKYVWEMKGKSITENALWTIESSRIPCLYLERYSKGLGVQQDSQIQKICEHNTKLWEENQIGRKQEGAIVMRNIDMTTYNRTISDAYTLCAATSMAIGDELINGGTHFKRPMSSLKEFGTLEEFLVEFQFYRHAKIINQITFVPLQRRLEAWAMRLGFGGLLSVAAKYDGGECWHMSGHIVTGAFCRAFGCSSETLEEDIRFSKGKCRGAITHTLTSAAMKAESEKLRMTSSESVHDDGTPKLRRESDYRLWRMLHDTAVRICSDPEVVKVHGDQLGECGHGVGHTVFDFELLQLQDPNSASFEELIEVAEVASNACWRLTFVDHKDKDFIIGMNGLRFSTSSFAFYCGSGVWHRFYNTISDLNLPSKDGPADQLSELISSARLLNMCAQTAIMASCYRYLNVLVFRDENRVQERDIVKGTGCVGATMVHGKAIGRLCGAMDKIDIVKSISNDQLFVQKQVYACCAMGFSNALSSCLQSFEESKGVLRINPDGILSTLINETKGPLIDKLSMEYPKSLLYPFVHNFAKYHRQYVESFCKIGGVSQSFQKDCLRWSDEGMYGTNVDWSWGIILPNETGAPFLPS